MKIAEQEWETCPTCERWTKIITQETWGCDECAKPIDMNKKGEDYLDATVFSHSGEDAKHLQFCSWVCTLRRLSKIKTDYFISLPHMSFDATKKATGAKEFQRLIRKALQRKVAR